MTRQGAGMRRVAETGHARGLRSRAEIGSETVREHLEIGRIDTEAMKRIRLELQNCKKSKCPKGTRK